MAPPPHADIGAPTTVPRSRGRAGLELASTAVAGTQRNGRALQTLIIGTLRRPPNTSALRAKCPLLPPLITIAFPLAGRNLLSSHLSGPGGGGGGANGIRRRFGNALRYRSAINMPCPLLLVRRLNYADQKIIEYLTKGVPIAGEIPGWRPLPPSAPP